MNDFTTLNTLHSTQSAMSEHNHTECLQNHETSCSNEDGKNGSHAHNDDEDMDEDEDDMEDDEDDEDDEDEDDMEEDEEEDDEQ